MPGMPDPRFEKSVIFMCAHSAQGAMGLIINKPIDGLSFHELVDKLGIGMKVARAIRRSCSAVRCRWAAASSCTAPTMPARNPHCRSPRNLG